VLLGQPAVDDVDHVIDRHGRLRQVRGQDDLSDARRGPLEDELLQGAKAKGHEKPILLLFVLLGLFNVSDNRARSVRQT
jgi:hypothetical protein